MSLKRNLEIVQQAVVASKSARAKLLKASVPTPVRLVAVSKTQPVEILMETYDAGHRHFGENYVEELVAKAPQMPKDVQWHFIGKLQAEKVGMLLKGCPSLACLETIDSARMARFVDSEWQKVNSERRLKVMVQVKSGKFGDGVDARDVVTVCRTITLECKGLELAGLMTIGAPDYSGCRPADFETLHKCRNEAATALGIVAADLELSMGMSADYENAIRNGSTSVRLGSTLFGARLALGGTTEGGNPDVASGAPPDVAGSWTHEELLAWLQEQGGVSKSGLEDFRAAKISGWQWLKLTEADIRSEEVGLEEPDVQRLLELQSEHKSKGRAASGKSTSEEGTQAVSAAKSEPAKLTELSVEELRRKRLKRFG